jgi:hypothetical protein
MLIVNTFCHPNAGRRARAGSGTPYAECGNLVHLPRQPLHEGGGKTVAAMPATNSGRRASDCMRTRC